MQWFQHKTDTISYQPLNCYPDVTLRNGVSSTPQHKIRSNPACATLFSCFAKLRRHFDQNAWIRSNVFLVFLFDKLRHNIRLFLICLSREQVIIRLLYGFILTMNTRRMIMLISEHHCFSSTNRQAKPACKLSFIMEQRLWNTDYFWCSLPDQYSVWYNLKKSYVVPVGRKVFEK